MSDHGEQKARVVPLEIRAMAVAAPVEDPLDQLRDLLAGASDQSCIVVTHVTKSLSDPSVTVRAKDLRSLVAEEIDRVAAAVADQFDQAKLEAAETRIMYLESRLFDLENALLPFAHAAQRHFITGDGTLADTYRDIEDWQLRDALSAMHRRGV